MVCVVVRKNGKFSDMNSSDIVIYGSNKEEFDIVSGEYEDSFSLESFKDLIEMYENAGKHFILARVKTWDHKKPGKEYYSYYNAYHLNKILFQTQVYFSKKLIHRLNVLNPLTNTDIVGDVQYFQVEEQTKSKEKIASTPTSPIANDMAKRNNEILKRTSLMMQSSLPPSIVINSPSANAEGAATWQSPLTDPDPETSTQPPISPVVNYAQDDIFIKSALVSDASKSKKKNSMTPAKSPLKSPIVEVRAPEMLMESPKVENRKSGIPTRFNSPIATDNMDTLNTPVMHRREFSAKNAANLGILISSQLENAELPVVHVKKRFVANFIGTDNDYLEKSKMRAHFRENALFPEDCYLFEMPEFVAQPNRVQMEMIDAWYNNESGGSESCIAEFCSLRPSNMNSMSPALRFFHLAKCYILALLVIGCMLFLILWTLLGTDVYKKPEPLGS